MCVFFTCLFGAAAEAGNDFAFHFVRVGRFGAGLGADDIGAGRHGDDVDVVG